MGFPLPCEPERAVLCSENAAKSSTLEPGTATTSPAGPCTQPPVDVCSFAWGLSAPWGGSAQLGEHQREPSEAEAAPLRVPPALLLLCGCQAGWAHMWAGEPRAGSCLGAVSAKPSLAAVLRGSTQAGPHHLPIAIPWVSEAARGSLCPGCFRPKPCRGAGGRGSVPAKAHGTCSWLRHRGVGVWRARGSQPPFVAPPLIPLRLS